MTLLMVDGFDLIATADLNRKWIAQPGAVSSPGRVPPGNKFDATNTITGPNQHREAGSLLYTFSANKVTAIIGFAINPQNYTGGNFPNQRVITYIDSAGAVQGQLAINAATGQLDFYRGNGVTLLCSSPALVVGVWVYVELLLTVDPSAGSVVIRFNGVSVATFSGNTRQTAITSFLQLAVGQLGGMTSPNTLSFSTTYSIRYDDIYILDTAGSLNNTYLGDIRVVGILPDGPGANTTWTKVGTPVSNWQCVNETAPDGDTTYVNSSTLNQIDTYTYSSLPSNTASVVAVISTFEARKDDAGPRTFTTRVRSGGTEADAPGSISPLLSVYSIIEQVMEVNPVTSAAWTVAEVNGAEFGPKLLT